MSFLAPVGLWKCYEKHPRQKFSLEVGTILAGEVEVDETFIGGKARNMRVAQRRRRITGTGGKD